MFIKFKPTRQKTESPSVVNLIKIIVGSSLDLSCTVLNDKLINQLLVCVSNDEDIYTSTSAL